MGIAQPERRARSFPHELSGGERQRVVIAIAIANDPDLLICDEPTTALDVTVQAQILEVLKTARDVTGAGVLIITHDLGVVAEFADRALVIYAGRAVETVAVADLYRGRMIPTSSGCSAPARAGRPAGRAAGADPRRAAAGRAVRWPSTPAAGLHRQGQNFAGAHEAFLTDELGRGTPTVGLGARPGRRGRGHPGSWQPPWECS